MINKHLTPSSVTLTPTNNLKFGLFTFKPMYKSFPQLTLIIPLTLSKSSIFHHVIDHDDDQIELLLEVLKECVEWDKAFLTIEKHQKERKFLRAILMIGMPRLLVLNLANLRVCSIEFLVRLDAPNLDQLIIDSCLITQGRGLRKCNFPNLTRIQAPTLHQNTHYTFMNCPKLEKISLFSPFPNIIGKVYYISSAWVAKMESQKLRKIKELISTQGDNRWEESMGCEMRRALARKNWMNKLQVI